MDTLTPNLSKTSALPEDEDTDLPPCLAIFTPAPAATNEAHVEMLNVFRPSPPVPQVSTTSLSVLTEVKFSLSTCAAAEISSTVSPFMANAVINAETTLDDIFPDII